MTTIVYDHKRGQIACDSRLTKGDVVIDDSSNKFTDTEKGKLFLAGPSSEFEVFASLIDALENGDLIEQEIGANGFLVSDKVYCVAVIDGALNYDPCTYSDGIGSGSSWALSSLDHGKTAKQAVQYAATRDIYTGGKVHVYDIKKGKFING